MKKKKTPAPKPEKKMNQFEKVKIRETADRSARARRNSGRRAAGILF